MTKNDERIVLTWAEKVAYSSSKEEEPERPEIPGARTTRARNGVIGVRLVRLKGGHVLGGGQHGADEARPASETGTSPEVAHETRALF